MDKKSKLFLAFGAGAVVGAAVAALLTTDKGKAILNEAGSKVDDLAENIKKKINDLEAELAEFLREDTSDENTRTGETTGL